jgi:kumamolisin
MSSVALRGSARAALPGSTQLADCDPAERLEVSLILRHAAAPALRSRVRALAHPGGRRSMLSREQFAARHGAAARDLAAVRAFARRHGLSVVQQQAARRTLVLSGTVAYCNAAFGIRLRQYVHADGTYRGHTGAIRLPKALRGIVEAVLGLDNRPQARPHFRVRPPLDAAAPSAAAASRAAAASLSYTPPQVASLYGFLAGDGAGQCIGLIELGGGFRPADLAAYFANLGLAAPAVIAVSVDQAANAPTGDPAGPDAEVMLDIEVSGAIAPGARIAAYFAPNTDAGFIDALSSAIHDTVNRPSVISISWGGPESSWSAQAMKAMDGALQAAAALGITVCVASGDNGSSDGVADGADHVDFPASSPFALACGGTSLRAAGSVIVSEVVWNDGATGGASGGGVSAAFPLPPWQSGLSATRTGGQAAALTARGVPDVAGNADPQTGYEVRVDGTVSVIGGTSAVAPLWAGLIARLNASRSNPAGYLNPGLYRQGQGLRDITQGNNGDFAAAVGWDACTGLGSPGDQGLGVD